jgi:acyl-CoA dehydrogenase
MTLFALTAISLAFLGLCFAGRAYWAWVVAGVIGLSLWLLGGVFSSIVFGLVATVFVGLAVLFGVTPLRKAIVAGPLLKAMRAFLPKMSATEREALGAGTVWWDGDLFSGAPHWKKLLDFRGKGMTTREKDFIDGPVDELCRMLDDDRVMREGDMSAEVWDFIKSKGFMGMIIPEQYGGLGFSAAAQSAIIARLSARCGTASVTVMVPNSLGPAELLLHYGTQEQRDRLLPRLAIGEEIPAFALTEATAGSDAASMKAGGVVCRGMFEGREVLGMQLNWGKRYITLAPVATLLGLAFKLRDPEHLLGDEEELGITCALIPAETPGVVTGMRHDPLGVPFMNGPTEGQDVFVPLDFIIGGPEMAGKGWGMLMQSLASGRGISLPSLSAGASELATRVTGAYATVREQFNMPIGRFEGIEDRLARIAGLTYMIDGGRRLTLAALDEGEKPSVVTAIMKAYSTEAMRVTINDAMDVVGGAGISRGPRNVLAGSYQAVPIGITVEGANILTRSMIIFGQGAIRCHPWVQDEMDAADANDARAFDEGFFGHVNFVFTNGARSFVHGLTAGGFVTAPVRGPAGHYFQKLSRMSSAFALVSDFAMATLGGALKRKENITGRLSDVLAHLYLGSGVLKKFVDEGSPERDLPAMRWAIEHCLYEMENALAGILQNLPHRPTAWLLRPLVFPLGRRFKPPTDRLSSKLARAILEDQPLREALTTHIFIPPADELGLGQLEHALECVMAARPAQKKLKQAQREKKLPRRHPELLKEAVLAGVLTEDDCDKLRAADEARTAVIQVDAFETLGAAAEAVSETAPAF